MKKIMHGEELFTSKKFKEVIDLCAKCAEEQSGKVRLYNKDNDTYDLIIVPYGDMFCDLERVITIDWKKDFRQHKELYSHMTFLGAITEAFCRIGTPLDKVEIEYIAEGED